VPADPSPAEERDARQRRLAALRAYESVRDRLAEFVTVVAEAETRADARSAVASRFDLTPEQADVLLQLRVVQMVRDEMRNVDVEIRDQEAQLATLDDQ
jgi:DNA gyrase/topoisomerase IV subunit A